MSEQMFQQNEMKNDLRNLFYFIPAALVIFAMIAGMSGVIIGSTTDIPLFEAEHTAETASLTP